MVVVVKPYCDRYGDDRIESIELIRLDDVIVMLAVVIGAVTLDETGFIIKGPVEPAGTLYLDTELVVDE